MTINPVTVISKGIGVLAAGLIISDAHKTAKAVSEVKYKSSVATMLTNEYLQSAKMPNTNSSLMHAKNKWLKFRMDNNLEDIVFRIKGYFDGLKASMSNDIIPALLATGAILGNRFGRVCSLGLIAYGIKVLIYDVFSVGKTDYVKK